MPPFTSLLTISALLVHLLAGCCWHHAHASSVAEVEAQHACCHHHDPADTAEHDPTPPYDGHCCDEGRCVTIPSDVAAVSSPSDLPSPACLDIGSAQSTATLDAGLTSSADLAANAGPPDTPVALHQVLRI